MYLGGDRPSWRLRSRRKSAAPAATAYIVFLRGAPVGREDVSIRTDAAGTTITSQGRMSAPANVVLQHVEFRYRPEGTAAVIRSRRIDQRRSRQTAHHFQGRLGGHGRLATGSGGGHDPEGVPADRSCFRAASSEGSLRLRRGCKTAALGDEFRVFLVPSRRDRAARLSAVQDERMQMGTTLFNVRRYELVFSDPGGDTTVNITTSTEGDVDSRQHSRRSRSTSLRSDVAGATSRTEVYSSPGDEAVMIPGPASTSARRSRFLAPYLAQPPPTRASSHEPPGFRRSSCSPARMHPIETASPPACPPMAQLAGTLAEAGFIAVRYDRRGSGQSGGRAESATLSDYAEDARAVVKWLTARKDVDPKRIALVGHDEGVWVALLAASREKRVAAVVSLAGPASTGASCFSSSSSLNSTRAKAPDAERDDEGGACRSRSIRRC